MVYDRLMDISGGQRHSFGGVIESLCVVPSPQDAQDIVYMIVNRTINGLTRRYVERLSQYWDFGLDLNTDSIFMDCALRGLAPGATSVYGLKHLQLELVDVLADGIPYRDLQVSVSGKLTLSQPMVTGSIVIGKRFVAEGEITGLDEGAADGTGQGKAKRPNVASIRLWDSYGGQLGRYNEDQGVNEYTPIEYDNPVADLQPVTLRTVTTQAFVLPMGYGNRGSVIFRTDDPFPFNVVAVYPQTDVNDR